MRDFLVRSTEIWRQILNIKEKEYRQGRERDARWMRVRGVLGSLFHEMTVPFPPRRLWKNAFGESSCRELRVKTDFHAVGVPCPEWRSQLHVFTRGEIPERGSYYPSPFHRALRCTLQKRNADIGRKTRKYPGAKKRYTRVTGEGDAARTSSFSPRLQWKCAATGRPFPSENKHPLASARATLPRKRDREIRLPLPDQILEI